MSKYRKQQILKYNNDILRVESHIPMIRNLIILGNQKHIINEKKVRKKSRCNSYSSENEELMETCIRIENYTTQEEKEPDISNASSEMCLEIDEMRFSSKNKDQKVAEYKLFVDYEIGKDDIISNYITITNCGNTALKYYWERQLPSKPLQGLIPKRLPSYRFIFNKNLTLILPGQKIHLDIFFKTKEIGFAKEIWVLNTEPNIFTSGKFKMVLLSHADMFNYEDGEYAIINRIYDGMVGTVKEETLLSILQDTNFTIMQKTYEDDDKMQYSAKDIFEAINAEFGPPGSVPKIYYYEKNLVSQLQSFYNILTTELNLEYVEPWNLKLSDLYALVDEIQCTKDRAAYRGTLDEIVGKFYVTNMIENLDDYKYFAVYNLLCTMINKISAFIYDIRSYYEYPLIEVYPPVTEEVLKKQDIFLKNEYRTFKLFPENYENENYNKQICEATEFDRPPLEALKSIPFEDVNARYIAYHEIMNPQKIIDLLPQPEKKKSIKGKARESLKKIKPIEPEKIPQIKKNPSQEPFHEQSFTELLKDTIIVKPSYIQDSIKGIPDDHATMYYINIYSVVYGMLCKTITEVEEILEKLNSTKVVSRKVLKKCMDIGVASMSSLSKFETQLPSYKLKQMHLTTIDLTSEENASLNMIPSGDIISRSSLTGLDSESAISYTSSDSLLTKEYKDAQTETDYGILYYPQNKSCLMQTDYGKIILITFMFYHLIVLILGDDEIDLIAIIEHEISATSIQKLKILKHDVGTQFDPCDFCDELEISNHSLNSIASQNFEM